MSAGELDNPEEHKKAFDEFYKKHKNESSQWWHKLFSDQIAEDGEWAGCPFPMEGMSLVLEPRYPFQQLADLRSEETDPEENLLRTIFEHNYKFINKWYNWNKGIEVWIFEIKHGENKGKRFHEIHNHRVDYGKKLTYWLSSLGVATQVWSYEAEIKAIEKLAEMLAPHRFQQYILTNTFLEKSHKSNVMYLFRKGRPTIALVPDETTGNMRILAVLCLHPIGYYHDSWAGVMVPTDDVIAHLSMMRGDEAVFWKKANKHEIWSIQAGV